MNDKQYLERSDLREKGSLFPSIRWQIEFPRVYYFIEQMKTLVSEN